MENSPLALFEHEKFGSLRVVRSDQGAQWFVAKDVCGCLGLDTSNLSKMLDEDELSTYPVQYTDQVRNLSVVSEPGLYSLILRSRKPEAKAFKRWVTHEVIPSIRKVGGYLIAKPDDTPEAILARAVLVAQETIERLKNRTAELEEDVQRMKPKELFADSVSASESSILVGQLAALLKQNGVNIGQNRLFERLRNDGFLIKFGERRNCPTQRALEMGLFELKERTVNNPDGSVRITLTTKVTGKGQVYFVNRYIGKNRKAA